MSAYVKKSGVDQLTDSINRFRDSGGKVKAVIGIGQKNTSIQGLNSLLPLCDEAWVYHNESATSTFHPKVYLFEKPNDKALLFIGSNNLTGGGLFSNYESALYTEYDLKDRLQIERFGKVKQMFQSYSMPSEFCKVLNNELLGSIAADYLSDEMQEPEEDAKQSEVGTGEASKTKKKVFGSKRFGRPSLPKSGVANSVSKPTVLTSPGEAQTSTWKNALLSILGRYYPQWVSLQAIYREIEQFRSLSGYEKEPWKKGKSQLRYENKIRTVLSDMAEEGLVEKMRGETGLWKLRKNTSR
jgi:hypothetical protein